MINPFDDLISKITDNIRQIIREELNAKNQRDLQERFLSPEETCKLFTPTITKPTLDSYCKKKLLKKYYLGGRTWFKYSELVKAVKEIKRFVRY